MPNSNQKYQKNASKKHQVVKPNQVQMPSLEDDANDAVEQLFEQ